MPIYRPGFGTFGMSWGPNKKSIGGIGMSYAKRVAQPPLPKNQCVSHVGIKM